jgi:ribosomal protein L11 methyltransferase
MSNESWWVWRRLISPRWEDSWLERVAWIGPERSVVHRVAGRKFLRLEVYLPELAMARWLEKSYGGVVLPTATPKLLGEPWKPVRIGRLVILPSEDPEEQDLSPLKGRAKQEGPGKGRGAGKGNSKERIRLLIPPGLAFGSGHHPTTQLLLRALLELGSRLQGVSLLDVGTGSGIIALAALCFGARPVFGLDVDPVAIREAQKNQARNFGQGGVRWICADFLSWKAPQRFCVVCANLYARLFVQGAEKLAEFLSPGGYLLATGILGNQVDHVEEALSRVGFCLEQNRKKGRWVLTRWLRKRKG